MYVVIGIIVLNTYNTYYGSVPIIQVFQNAIETLPISVHIILYKSSSHYNGY